MSYKSFKIGFNSFFKPEEKELIKEINIKVLEVNKIVYNTYSFIKSYFLYLVQKDQPLPQLDVSFIRVCFKLFYTSKYTNIGCRSVDTKTQLATLRSFLNVHDIQPSITKDTVHVCNFLTYEARDMIKNYENMIKFTFANKVRKYVDDQFLKPVVLSAKEKKLDKEQRKEILRNIKETNKLLKPELEVVKRDILEERYPPKSKRQYLDFIQRTKDTIIGDDLLIRGLYYDIKVNPLFYLVPALKLKLNILPLRRSFIPTYITLDNFSIKGMTRSKLSYEEVWKKYTFLHELPQFKKYKKKV